MKLHRASRMRGNSKGDGWYVSLITRSGFLLVAVRPTYWRIARVALPNRPGVTRYYFGPLEIEISDYLADPVGAERKEL